MIEFKKENRYVLFFKLKFFRSTKKLNHSENFFVKIKNKILQKKKMS